MWNPFVSSATSIWETYQTAKLWRVRPSELLGVSDPWTAYCLDNAVAHFGNALTAELDAVEGKNSKEINKKRERLMTKWLDLPQRFRSPGMATKGKTEDSEIEQQFTVKGDVS